MNPSNLFLKSLRNALATAAYVIVIALFLSNIERIFQNPDDTFLAPVFMLLLFIISAAVTGFLVIGKPIMLYVNGNKQEAISLFLYTIGWLVIVAIIVIVSIVAI